MKKIFYSFLGVSMFLGVGLFCNAASDYQNHPYAYNIKALYDSGVVEGYGDGVFLPNNAINRAEFLKIAMEYFKVSTGGADCFIDVKNEWFAKYVCAAHEKGFIEGYGNGVFKPQANISFAEASKIIYNLSKGSDVVVSNPWYKKYVENLANKKAIPFSITGFNHLLTRGEMAEIVANAVNYDNGYEKSLSYDDLLSLNNISVKDNFALRFQKFYGHQLKKDGVPDGLDYGTFQRIMIGTSACGFNADGSDGCELVESELYRDANRIYNYPPDKYEHKLTVIENADAASFQVRPDIDTQYAFDKNNFYVTNKENPFYHKSDEVPAKVQLELDKAKFDTVYDSKMGSFLKDKNGFYYVLDDFKNPRKIESFNADNFKLIADIESVLLFSDGQYLYMAKQMKSYLYTSEDIVIKKLDYVDLASFELLKSEFENSAIADYFKDKSKMYYFSSFENVPIEEGFYYTVSNEFLREITGVDAGTLEAIQPNGGLAREQYFKDKNGVYLANGGKVIKIDGADKETFEIIFVFKYFDKFSPAYPGYYLKDKNSVWILNPEKGIDKVVGISPEGFDYAKYLKDKGVEHWEEKGG